MEEVHTDPQRIHADCGGLASAAAFAVVRTSAGGGQNPAPPVSQELELEINKHRGRPSGPSEPIRMTGGRPNTGGQKEKEKEKAIGKKRNLKKAGWVKGIETKQRTDENKSPPPKK